ncbi:MAG: PepSY domain-containing protein [Clostridiales bacterium]|nr:PepSY domain-containing protein [Clostridiales bacterium]MDY4037124.1 PepSY domain-containing protein [Candidatus Pseudoscilispira sp.]
MQYTQSHLVRSIVSVDVNPSVELKLNAKSRVISAIALNRDGEEILEGLKLKGADADAAINALIGSLLQHAGISAKDVYDLSVEAELDERIPHYEVEFKSGGMEYGYEIDASTGAVLQYETERDD